MDGFLRGKCLPGDMKVNETNAEYLVRKFTALEQQLAESQREFRSADATIENLQMQLNAERESKMALAAENSAVKVMNDCLSEELRGYESDGAFEGPKMHLLWWKAETPATDAFLAKVRASAIEHAASERWGSGYTFDVLNEFAAQLRQGVQS
ncbi:TPA: hypothetical protein L3381_000945 [Escherichia coli]|nr:hypothetical protein [Escherichia coli]